MTKLLIFVVGSMLLFLMEAGFSLALRRYDLPGHAVPFFRGPISVTISRLMRQQDGGNVAARSGVPKGNADPHSGRSK